jgi:hypothetical protein
MLVVEVWKFSRLQEVDQLLTSFMEYLGEVCHTGAVNKNI